jgi:hypothetical protein
MQTLENEKILKYNIVAHSISSTANTNTSAINHMWPIGPIYASDGFIVSQLFQYSIFTKVVVCQ